MKNLSLILAFSILVFNSLVYAQQWQWTTYDPANTNSKLPDNNVNYLTTDATGNIWIGTSFGGLVKFDGTNWTSYNTTNSSLKDNIIKDVAVDNSNNIWACVYGKGLDKFNGSTAQEYHIINSL